MLGIEELVGRRDVVGLGVGKYAHGEYVAMMIHYLLLWEPMFVQENNRSIEV